MDMKNTETTKVVINLSLAAGFEINQSRQEINMYHTIRTEETYDGDEIDTLEIVTLSSNSPVPTRKINRNRRSRHYLEWVNNGLSTITHSEAISIASEWGFTFVHSNAGNAHLTGNDDDVSSRKKTKLYTVRSLDWKLLSLHDGDGGAVAETPFGSYSVWQGDGETETIGYYWAFYSNGTYVTGSSGKSLEDCRSQCNQHWESAILRCLNEKV